MENRTVNNISSAGKKYMKSLLKSLAMILALSLVVIGNVPGRQSSAATGKIEPLPRDLEIELALSALPPHLRDGATVYTLNPAKGFEVAREGSNGFHTLVARTDQAVYQGAWPFTEYRDDILIPISFDKAGAVAHMQVIFDAAEMQAKGVSSEEMKKTIADKYKTGHYKAPERAGISYMLSPILRTYHNPAENDRAETLNMPHIMYYAPNVTNEDIGGKYASAYPFVIVAGPHGYFIQAMGRAETEAITKENENMLGELCQIKEAWCLPKS